MFRVLRNSIPRFRPPRTIATVPHKLSAVLIATTISSMIEIDNPSELSSKEWYLKYFGQDQVIITIEFVEKYGKYWDYNRWANVFQTLGWNDDTIDLWIKHRDLNNFDETTIKYMWENIANNRKNIDREWIDTYHVIFDDDLFYSKRIWHVLTCNVNYLKENIIVDYCSKLDWDMILKKHHDLDFLDLYWTYIPDNTIVHHIFTDYTFTQFIMMIYGEHYRDNGYEVDPKYDLGILYDRYANVLDYTMCFVIYTGDNYYHQYRFPTPDIKYLTSRSWKKLKVRYPDLDLLADQKYTVGHISCSHDYYDCLLDSMKDNA